MGTRRMARVNDLIRREISDLLLREARDPRLSGLLSVTEVVTSPDLRHAKIYVSVMGSDDEKRQAEEGLAAACGFLRRSLGARLTLRYVPELTFERDESIERGSRLLELMKQVTPGDSLGKAD
jgi:ribosome-binding factor A